MLIASHELLGSPENLGDEMVLCSNLVSEFASRIARRVDLAPEVRFGFPKCRSQLCEAHPADDHQVHVAERVLLAAGHRAVDKGAIHTRLKWRQHVLERWQDADCLLDQAAELG